MKTHLLLITLILVFLSSCRVSGNVNTVVTIDTDIKKYKIAYIRLLKNDEFNLGSAIINHISNMGIAAEIAPVPDDVTDENLIVRYSYKGDVDISKYLKSFNIQFYTAKSKKLLVHTSYHLTGNWRDTQYRINYTFNDIRIKLGLSPLEAFSE